MDVSLRESFGEERFLTLGFLTQSYPKINRNTLNILKMPKITHHAL